MKKIATLSLGLLASLALSEVARAGADCPKNPQNEWISEKDMKKKIEDMGYKIKKFKVDGECYEIYGWNKEGKKAEVYFNTKTAEVVKSEIGE